MLESNPSAAVGGYTGGVGPSGTTPLFVSPAREHAAVLPDAVTPFFQTPVALLINGIDRSSDPREVDQLARTGSGLLHPILDTSWTHASCSTAGG